MSVIQGKFAIRVFLKPILKGVCRLQGQFGSLYQLTAASASRMATVLFERLVIMRIFAHSQFLVKYKLHLRGLNKDSYLSVITMI